jgi:hypothetical protein
LEDRGETIVVRIPLANDLNSTAIDEMRRDRDAFLVQLHTARPSRERRASMSERKMTYERLFELLQRIGFEDVSDASPPYRVFRHPSTETILAFAAYPGGTPVRDADLILARKQLDFRGLLAEEAATEAKA